MLSARRFHHSRCVCETAVFLAEKYGADPQKAAIAGMLHDIMKDTPVDAQLKMIERFGIILTSEEKRETKLLHAISGAAYAAEILEVSDPEILHAIRWHTSGRKGMSKLEKLIFVADYISADRVYPEVEQIRRFAGESLELAMYEGIRHTVTEELMRQKRMVALEMIEAYNDILSVIRP